MMETNKRSFNKRAFTAIMSGLTALTLPITGLIVHGYSEGAISGDKHSWLMAHVVLGFLFVVFAAWHALINRRALLNYIKGVGGSLPGK
jgi:hypothetical protein